METRAHYVLIGSVVLFLVGAGFLFVLWIGSGQRDYDSYDVIFKERVSGLSTGSIVRFNGIQKGEVESLSIDPANPGIVVARVRVDKDTPIKTDTTAELEPVGFTGLAIIQFVGGSPDAALLKRSSDRRIPQIEAETGAVNAFLLGAGDIVARASELLSDENIQAFQGTLANIDAITGAVAENDQEISRIIQSADQATADLADVIADLKSSSDSLDQLLSQSAPQTLESANQLLAESELLISELQAIANENRESIRVFTDRGLGQVAPALAEARKMMRSLDYVLRELERDPKAFLLGETAPQYQGADE